MRARRKESLRYLRLTGRSEEQIALVEAYAREQGLFHDAKTPEAEYSELMSLDLSTVESSLAGPKRPQDRVVLSKAGESFLQALPSLIKPKAKAAVVSTETSGVKQVNRWEQEGGNPTAVGVEDPNVHEHISGNGRALQHGSVVIAAITSCTNTSNPSVLIAAGLLAKKAVERGLEVPATVKTSLAPGSKVVLDYLQKAGLMSYLEKLKFHIVGYGCTTCIGNSGPLPVEVSKEIDEKNLVVASVLSGNRNFEGRINSEVRANYLMSPPLVVAFALAGRIDVDLRKDPVGKGKTASRYTSPTSGRRSRKSSNRWQRQLPRRCSARATAKCTQEMNAGAVSRFQRVKLMRGRRTQPTFARLLISMA